jgi:hypothetical protein
MWPLDAVQPLKSRQTDRSAAQGGLMKSPVGRFVIVAALVGLTCAGLSFPAGAASGGQSWPGVGTKQALANPNCDASTGRLKMKLYWAGPCVTAWPEGKNNGGSTSSGVTKDSIKVVYYDAAEDNAMTGPQFPGTQDAVALLEHFYETYGRKIDLVQVRASGTDETSQRADAVKIAAMKPFIVVDNPAAGGDVFDAAIAREKIISLGWNVTPEVGEAQAPYRWGNQPDDYAAQLVVAQALSKLAKGKAQYAGDTSMQSENRKIGVLHPDSIDYSLFKNTLKKAGVTLAADLEYPYVVSGNFSDATKYQDQLTTFISKLKSAGVTTVALFADNNLVAPLTKAATGQDYSPEWFLTGFHYQDLDIFGRSFDQTQWAHAFGVMGLYPAEGDATTVSPQQQRLYQWYFGNTRPVGNNQTYHYNSGREMGIFNYSLAAISLAGPKLTPQSFEKALFAYPPSGGAASKFGAGFMQSWGKHGYYPWTDYTAFDDVTLGWWDPTAEGVSNAIGSINGTGKYRYVNNAKRYAPGQLPKTMPKFFDESASLLAFPGPADASLPDYQCNGCPSSGS